MDLTLKNRIGLPSLITDFLTPSSLFGRDFWEMDPAHLPNRLGFTLPTANIKETPKEFKVEIAAPGLNQKDFNIEIHNHTLKISAEKEQEETKHEEEYYQKEYSFHSFCRTFSLPENIKDDHVKAKYDSGVLSVTIPKEKETKIKPTRKIAVT